MSRLIEIQSKLLDTSAALAQLERAVVKEPNSPSLQSMAESLKKRQRVLDSEFRVEANNLGIDICTYRIFGDQERQSIGALAQVLGDFQTLVTTVYDVVKSKVPKVRARPSVGIASETEFSFGYAYSGSVGIMLTIPNERFLLIESDLDQSFSEIASMTKAKDTAEISQYAKTFGAASVRSLYKWVSHHDNLGLGADIKWQREHEIRGTLLAQHPEFQRLHRTIEQTSEETTAEIQVVGMLMSASVSRKTFELHLDNKERISGSFVGDAISELHTIELPKKYKATVVKTEQIRYSTEENLVSYRLLRIEPVEQLITDDFDGPNET
jgi:hypothetical protein